MSRGPARRGLPRAAGVAAPADRRFRRAEVTTDRRRLARAFWRVSRWVVPAVLVVGAVIWSVRSTIDSDLLTVRRVTVRGNSRLSAGDIVSRVNGMRGEPILRVDLQRYRALVMDSPWVGDATLSRVLPSTIQIRIRERVPMAIARAGTQLYLMDETGAVIDEYNTDYADLDLPIVDGLIPQRDHVRTAGEPDPVVLTSALLGALHPRHELLAAISQVDVSNPRDAVVMLDGDPTWLHLGDARFAERLQSYLELRPTFQERFQDIDSVDLRYDQRIYVHRPDAGRGGARTIK